MISTARAAYRMDDLTSAWHTKIPHAVSRKTSAAKPVIVLAGIKSQTITAQTANRK